MKDRVKLCVIEQFEHLGNRSLMPLGSSGSQPRASLEIIPAWGQLGVHAPVPPIYDQELILPAGGWLPGTWQPTPHVGEVGSSSVWCRI